MKRVNLFSIGDSDSDSIFMLISYTTNVFSIEYIPTIFDNYNSNVMIEGNPINLTLFGTSTVEDFHKICENSSPQVDSFLVCFSLISRSSFENIKNIWIPQIQNSRENVPFFLIGTHLDLRDDQETIKRLEEKGLSPVSYEDGANLAQEIKAVKYLECSSVTQKNLKNVFDEAILFVLNPQKFQKPNQSKNKCLIF
ncbi:ras-related c3 botulinum toxin substrate 1 [Anaeramoeba ignava]|uniref:Ras-related c3 botulinum toxin substrate 1 n=1 Tax=Anaeramoeba ignava TaxID=1746090 RepID=A0A9Q0LFW3_ANAIG|nr:ras-related c3 botulinum toxin substrate 1 [Anaeramoeba ignava]